MPKYYGFLFTGDGDDRLDTMLPVADVLDGLPETAATFRPCSFIDDWQPRPGYKKMLKLQHTWPVPEDFQDNNAGTSFANPHGRHASRYADAFVRCECGAVVVRSMNADSHLKDRREEHADDCRVQWKYQAESALWDRRRDVLEECAELAWPAKMAAKRLDLMRNTVHEVARRLDMNYEQARLDGRQKLINTWAILRRRHGYTAIEVARAFRRNPTTVRNWSTGNGRNIEVTVDV